MSHRLTPLAFMVENGHDKAHEESHLHGWPWQSSQRAYRESSALI